MSVEYNDVYPNARLSLTGGDVTVVSVDSGVVAVAQDDGEVKHYTHDSFVENASPYEPPQEPAATDVTGTTGNTASTVVDPVVPAVDPATEPIAPVTPADPSNTDERIAQLEAQLAAARAGRQQTP